MDQISAFYNSDTLQLPSNNLGGYKLQKRRKSAVKQYDFPNTVQEQNIAATAAKLGIGLAKTLLIPERLALSEKSQPRTKLIQQPPGKLEF